MPSSGFAGWIKSDTWHGAVSAFIQVDGWHNLGLLLKRSWKSPGNMGTASIHQVAGAHLLLLLLGLLFHLSIGVRLQTTTLSGENLNLNWQLTILQYISPEFSFITGKPST